MHLRIFAILSLLLLSILPVLNVVSSEEDFDSLEDVKELYSTDVLERHFNRVLISTGISTNSKSVLIGKDEWLFLGDEYDQTVTVNRLGSNLDSVEKLSNKIVSIQGLWEMRYKAKGVKEFKIIVGPNKSSIYPEFLPQWAKSPDSSISKHLYGNNIYVSVIDELIGLKGAKLLYYSQDTHWNFYGAGAAFNYFIKNLETADQLNVPPIEWGDVVESHPRQGGDLTPFLKIAEDVKDVYLLTKINKSEIEHVIYDFNSNKEVYRGLNSLHGSMNDRYLIKTASALNDKKVLWLSDSFGDALAPYMTATFSTVLKQHWEGLLGNTGLEELIEEWKPDYVFYTIVERSSLHPLFLMPPKPIVHGNLEIFSKIALSPPALHDVSQADDEKYTVQGNDPFLVYELDAVTSGEDAHYLSFHLDCDDFKGSGVPVQVFWRPKDADFNEVDSFSFNARKGDNQIAIHDLIDVKDLFSIRVDLKGQMNDLRFILNEVKLGIPAK